MRGLLEPSASDCNQLALRLARDHTKKNKVLCSNLSHKSIADACHALRLEPVVVDAVPRNGFQVDEEKLRDAISAHKNDLAAIVSTYGTTQLGNIENLASNPLVQQLRQEGVWLHVDAAYGCYIGQLSSFVKKPIPDSDSITIDQYKFIGKPGVALLLADKKKIPVNEVSYYVHSQCTNHTTLSAGPIAAWAHSVREVGGIPGLREIADQCIKIARDAAFDLSHDKVPLACPPELSIVPLCLDSAGQAASMHAALLQQGYSVGKVHIKGLGYEVNGIRVVITPKVNPDRMASTTRGLCNRISDLYHKN
jgi:glutamate/tyrosine decarboxylase-like PLP-dependent enzyme